jgi:hypothetical protein
MLGLLDDVFKRYGPEGGKRTRVSRALRESACGLQCEEMEEGGLMCPWRFRRRGSGGGESVVVVLEAAVTAAMGKFEMHDEDERNVVGRGDKRRSLYISYYIIRLTLPPTSKLR